MRYNRRAIDQELQAALGLQLPKLDLDARAGVGYGNMNGGDADWNREVGSIGLTLRQNLYDGNESRSEQRRQGDRVLSARSRVEDTAKLHLAADGAILPGGAARRPRCRHRPEEC